MQTSNPTKNEMAKGGHTAFPAGGRCVYAMRLYTKRRAINNKTKFTSLPFFAEEWEKKVFTWHRVLLMQPSRQSKDDEFSRRPIL